MDRRKNYRLLKIICFFVLLFFLELEIEASNGNSQNDLVSHTLDCSNNDLETCNDASSRDTSRRDDLQKKIEQGDSESLYTLADYYYLGHQFTQESLKVKSCFTYDCEKQQREYQGIGNIADNLRDYKTAFKLYQQAALQDHLGAIWMLGECYELGRGIRKNLFKALEKYQYAALKEYAPAQRSLGEMYEYGFIVSKDLREALKWYEKAARQGEIRAQYLMGWMYRNGQGVSQDYDQAIKWYRAAAAQGSAFSQCGLGYMYSKGQGVRQDCNEAVKWYKAAAHQGNVFAQYNLGVMYRKGEGVPQDYDQAIKWYRAAAIQGDREAQNSLGIMYREGQGVKQNYVTACAFFEASAKQGNDAARCSFGYMYYKGQGVPQDYNKAREWYEKAARQGDANAQYNLGQIYFNGQGVSQDYDEAREWFQKAVTQGDASAQNSLGIMYREGEGVEQNYLTACALFEASAKQGDVLAQCNLSYAYFNGQGIIQDRIKANEWYERAAEQGNAVAQCNLGTNYQYGYGVPRNNFQAFKWYYKAAQQGYIYAQCQVGYMYSEGQGVPQDYDQAIKWYKAAAHQGDVLAQYNLGVMYRKGEGVPQDYNEAIKWYKKAADQQNPDALCFFGIMYDFGINTPKDKVKAAEWYRKAVAQGEGLAQGNLAWIYALSEKFKQNRYEAFELWRKSSEKQQVESEHVYSLLHLFNQNTSCVNLFNIKSYFRALRRYEETKQAQEKVETELTQRFYTSSVSLKKGVERRERDAFYIQGIMYLLNVKGEQDLGEGLKNLRYAAKDYHFLATITLQDIYKAGLGVVTDYFESLKWQAYILQYFNHKRDDTDSNNLSNVALFHSSSHWVDVVGKYSQEHNTTRMLTETTHFSPKRITTLQEIKDLYDIFLFDMGGVVTDGQNPFFYAIETINQLVQDQSSCKKKVIFISNSARPKEVIEKDLIKYGLKEELFDKGRNSYISVVTAGDFACARLEELLTLRRGDQEEKQFVYHFSFGSNENKDLRNLLQNKFIKQTIDPTQAQVILLSQFIDQVGENFETSLRAYGEELDTKLKAVAAHVNVYKTCQILCVNPDQLTPYGGGWRYCAGAFAHRLRIKYGVPKDQITYCGKPKPTIYESIFNDILGTAPQYNKMKDRTVMIGDSLENDILGAYKAKIDSILVLTGTTKQHIEQQKAPQDDLWDYLARFYLSKKASPRYFMDSLTDDFVRGVDKDERTQEESLLGVKRSKSILEEID